MKFINLASAPYHVNFYNCFFTQILDATPTQLFTNEGSFDNGHPVERDPTTLAVVAESSQIASATGSIPTLYNMDFDGATAYGSWNADPGGSGLIASNQPFGIPTQYLGPGVGAAFTGYQGTLADGTYVYYLFEDAGTYYLAAHTFIGTTWTYLTTTPLGVVTGTFFGQHAGYIWIGVDNGAHVYTFDGATLSLQDILPLDTTPWYSFTAYNDTVFVRTLTTVYALEFSGGSINVLGTLSTPIGTPPPTLSEVHFPRETLYYDGTYLYVLRIVGPDDATRHGFTDIYEYSAGTFTPVLTADHTPLYPGSVGGGNGNIYNSVHVPDEYGPFTILMTSNVLTAADFTANYTSVSPNVDITFTNLAQAGSSYLWDFGDGDTSTDENPTHSYDTVGDYTVSLEVTFVDAQVETEVKTDYITVSLLTAAFSATNREGSDPLTVSFTDESEGGPVTFWRWTFGDGTMVEGQQNPTHTYTEPGIYNVTLYVSSATEEASTTQSQYVIVNPVYYQSENLIIQSQEASTDRYWRFYADADGHLIFQDGQRIYKTENPVIQQGVWTLVEYHAGDHYIYATVGADRRRQWVSSHPITLGTAPTVQNDRLFVAENSSMEIDELRVWSREVDLEDDFRANRVRALLLSQ